MRTIVVAGSRSFSNPFQVALAIDEFFQKEAEAHGRSRVVHGGARGADAMCAEAAARHGHEVIEVKADWERYGKRAGYLRNRQMIEQYRPSAVFAWWNGSSSGTRHTLSIAAELAIPTVCYQLG